MKPHTIDCPAIAARRGHGHLHFCGKAVNPGRPHRGAHQCGRIGCRFAWVRVPRFRVRLALVGRT